MTGQFASLDEDLTGRENLVLLARLWGFRGKSARERADQLLATFDLADAATRQVKDYSGGMRRQTRHRGLAHRDARRAVPRRADDGPRPGGAQERVAHDSAARGLGRHDPADDAVHGRGGPARGSHCCHRPWQEDCRGLAARTQGGDGLGFSARRSRGTRSPRGSRQATRGAPRRHSPTQRGRRHARGSRRERQRTRMRRWARSSMRASSSQISRWAVPSLEEVFFALTLERPKP